MPESMRELLAKHSLLGKLNLLGNAVGIGVMALGGLALAGILVPASLFRVLWNRNPSEVMVWAYTSSTLLSMVLIVLGWKHARSLPESLRWHVRFVVVVIALGSLFTTAEGWHWMNTLQDWRPSVFYPLVFPAAAVMYGIGIRRNRRGNDSALNCVG